MYNFNEQFNNNEENNNINFDIIKNIKSIGEINYAKRKMINNFLNKERSKNNLQKNLMFVTTNFLNKFKEINTHIDLPINFKHVIFKNFTKNSKYKYLYNIQCYSEKKNNLKIINNNLDTEFENNLNIKSNQIRDYNNYNINEHFNINNNYNNDIINNNNNNNKNKNNYNNYNNHNKDYYKEIENSLFNQKELEEKIIFQKKIIIIKII